MGTFIDDAIKNYSNNREFEDAVIQGQIIDAKSIIQQAIMRNKNSATWIYGYDSYDSYTDRICDLYQEYSGVDFANYKTSTSSADKHNAFNGVCEYLINLVYHHKGGPAIPPTFDYAYVERTVEKELWNLGCKRVEVIIGPRTVRGKKRIGKKSFLTGKYKYQDYDTDIEVIKWMISISW